MKFIAFNQIPASKQAFLKKNLFLLCLCFYEILPQSLEKIEITYELILYLLPRVYDIP